jgi:hypothetical protein
MADPSVPKAAQDAALRALPGRLTRLALIYAGSAALATNLLVTFGLELTQPQMLMAIPIAAVTVPCILATDLLGIIWMLRPFRAYQRAVGRDSQRVSLHSGRWCGRSICPFTLCYASWGRMP